MQSKIFSQVKQRCTDNAALLAQGCGCPGLRSCDVGSSGCCNNEATCCPGNFACSSSQSIGMWLCCPLPNANCCANNKCCPSNYPVCCPNGCCPAGYKCSGDYCVLQKNDYDSIYVKQIDSVDMA
jgi:hypothetical protein